MEMDWSSLFKDLAHPCYSKRFIPISEIREGSCILFGHMTWRMLILVKKTARSHGGAADSLVVDIKEAYGCREPLRRNDLYLQGVDISVKSDEGKILHIPFLHTGQGILLSENISADPELQLQGLFYEINTMHILDMSRSC